jgi:hypothetical protein
MREKGDVLEDSITDYFRRLGFDVETRVKMRDRFDVSHEIDVLASKNEPFGKIRVAVECKHVDTSIDIREVRNFHDKLSALGITKGILASTGGFTVDAQSHAQALGLELWDANTLREKLVTQEMPKGDAVHDALPFHPTVLGSLSPTHLRNLSLLSESVELQYKPYHFVDFHCFSQHTVRDHSVVIEGKGTVVIDGVSGEFVDRRMTVTGAQAIPSGPLAECIGMPLQIVNVANLPAQLSFSQVTPRIDPRRARDIARMELVKNITLNFRFRTARTSGTRIVKPRMKDIDILNVQPVKLPILIGTYRFRNQAYTRTMLATTGKFILDQTTSCKQCGSRAVSICENCGGLTCEAHHRKCSVCEKSFCDKCVASKGVISKKYYCTQHKLTN